MMCFGRAVKLQLRHQTLKRFERYYRLRESLYPKRENNLGAILFNLSHILTDVTEHETGDPEELARENQALDSNDQQPAALETSCYIGQSTAHEEHIPNDSPLWEICHLGEFGAPREGNGLSEHVNPMVPGKQ